MWGWATTAAVAVIGGGIFSGLLYHRRRARLYRELASRRDSLVQHHGPRLGTTVDPQTLQEEFARERIVRIENFLRRDSLAALQRECRDNADRIERSYLPTHKKGGTLSYERVHRYAPACLAMYHAPAIHAWLATVVGVPLQPTADHDQSACSILYYNEPGDHINWHYDHNFYKGRHFTVLLSLVNRAPQGGVSAGKLMKKRRDGSVEEFDTKENVLVVFEGAQVLHRASPIEAGDERVMLSMTFCTDPRIGLVREIARRVKDTAFYGPRVLVD